MVFVTDRKGRTGKTALVLFAVQLVLNIIWSFLFFGAHALLFAAVDIAALWVVLIATIVYFFKINRAAAWMLIPYILWVTFATVLTFTLFFMN